MLNLFSYALRAKWSLASIPKRSLIWFDLVSPLLCELGIKEISAQIPARGETCNARVLVRALLIRDGLPLTLRYFREAVQQYEPRVIGTSIDNSDMFHQLCRLLPNIESFFVQNGVRVRSLNFFSLPQPYPRGRVNKMFVFNEFVGREFSARVDGECVVIGSAISNAIPVQSVASADFILFVSQFLDPPKDGLTLFNGRRITHAEFNQDDARVFCQVSNFAKARGKSLVVLGRTYSQDGVERHFFQSALGPGSSMEFLPRQPQTVTYRLLDEARMVCSVDSTLGYEAFSRRRSGVCMFSIRSQTLGDESFRFGWPMSLPEVGHFWTSNSNEEAIDSVLNRVYERVMPSDAVDIGCALMPRDEGNSTLRRFLRDAGVAAL